MCVQLAFLTKGKKQLKKIFNDNMMKKHCFELQNYILAQTYFLREDFPDIALSVILLSIKNVISPCS